MQIADISKIKCFIDFICLIFLELQRYNQVIFGEIEILSMSSKFELQTHIINGFKLVLFWISSKIQFMKKLDVPIK